MKDSSGLKQLIDQYFTSLKLEQRLPVRLYEPIDYILKLKAKRMRPILTMLSYHAVSGQPAEEAIDLATAVELFHNFTLMHDDIMDRAPVRRGKPAVHKVWGEDVAILSGDALFAYSVGFVGRRFPDTAHLLCEEFSRVALIVCEGQMDDMDLAESESVSIARYMDMIRKKTATLIGGCMSLGAMAGGASEDIVSKCYAFGEQVGLAFQLQDDLMDAFPPESFGKQVGGDILEKKKTYLYIKALELADEAEAKRLRYLYEEEENPHKKISEVLGIFRSLDIENQTLELVQHYFDSARNIGVEIATNIDFEPIRLYLQEIAKRQI